MLRPGLRQKPIVGALHRDLIFYGADQRAQITADALALVHSRYAVKWRSIGSVNTPKSGGVQLRNRSAGDADATFCSNHVRCDVMIGCEQRAVEMDALMRTIPACRVAKFAADAFAFMNTSDDFVVEAEVLPLMHVGQRKSAKVIESFVTLCPIHSVRPSAMSLTMRYPKCMAAVQIFQFGLGDPGVAGNAWRAGSGGGTLER